MRLSNRLVMVPIGLGLLALGAIQFWHGIQSFSGSASAATVVDDKRLAAIRDAAAEFGRLAQDAAKAGQQPPRQSDPKVKALLDTVFDTSLLNTAQPLPRSEIQNVNEWMLQVLNVGTVYLLAGTGHVDFSKAASLNASEQEKLQAQVTSNTVAFAPEIGRFYDGELMTMGALAWAVTADMSTNPDNFKSAKSQSGLGKLRGGLVNTLVGAVTTFSTDGLTDEWRRDRIPGLKAIAPKAAVLLLPDQREAVHDTSVRIAQVMSDAAVKSGLTDFAAALAK